MIALIWTNKQTEGPIVDWHQHLHSHSMRLQQPRWLIDCPPAHCSPRLQLQWGFKEQLYLQVHSRYTNTSWFLSWLLIIWKVSMFAVGKVHCWVLWGRHTDTLFLLIFNNRVYGQQVKVFAKNHIFQLSSNAETAGNMKADWETKFPPGIFEEIKKEHPAHWLLNVTTVDNGIVTQ